MQPLELTIEGFRSHRERHTFTFEGRGLFGIVGPTGAGKSSILEAIVFALYGKTVRTERDTKRDLINSRSDELRVQLLFENEGAVWEVTRTLRRKGSSQFVIRNRDDEAPAATGEKAVNAKVVELLGLDFDAFCSSVVLSQGDFDRFLKATPGPRSKILKGVFGLERIDVLRETARARSARVQGKLQAFQSELENLPADPSMLEQMQTELGELTKRLDETRASLGEASKAEREVQNVDLRISTVDQRGKQVEASRKSVPDVEDLEELGAAETRVAREVESTRSRVASSTKALEEVREQFTRAEELVGGPAALEAARDIERLRREIKTLEAERNNNTLALQKAQEVATKATDTFERLEQQRIEAEHRVQELHRTHAAHLLRKDLAPGEPCPVCEQNVASPPSPGRVARLDTAEKSLATIADKAARARGDLEKANQSAVVNEERLAQITSRREGLVFQLESARATLTELFGEVEDPVAELRARQEKAQRSSAALGAAQRQLQDAEALVRVADKKSEEVSARRRRFAGGLIEICAGLQIPPPPVDAGSDELLDAAKRALDAIGSELGRGEKEKAQLERLAQASRDSVAAFRSKYLLSDEDPLTQALEDQTARAGALRSEIEATTRGLARAQEVTRGIEVLAKDAELYARLSADLTDHKFTAYMLDGRRRLLAQLGSEKLMELTGRYRFDDEGEFQIADESSGTTRTAETLSGGETFLASLALALALADVVAQQGGRLGCFFLDEGFGSLDPESLDLALEGIEAIAVPGRLIGLISHVGGIRARLDDLIVLDKNEDGTTAVVQTEGPIAYLEANI